MALSYSVALLSLLVCAGAVRVNDDMGLDFSVARASTIKVESPTRPECNQTVAHPGTGELLQGYFDGMRKAYGIIDDEASFLGSGGLVDPAKCTKKDVCLLMRQLDMDFYSRARMGLLTDHDYDNAPQQSWVMHGDCSTRNSGYKNEAVMQEEVCRRAAKKRGVYKFRKVSDPNLPTGCVVKVKDKKYKTITLNEMKTDVKVGISYVGKRWNRYPVQTMVLCEMDRSLGESGAAYYSPYKLKPSMEGREAHSTSCSFGMYAFLAKLRETMSPCAKILTYKAMTRFHSAQHALSMAGDYEKANKPEVAQKIREYVETIRQKFTLIDTISNRWCPGIWTDAKARGGAATCDVPRVMAWTEEGRKLAQSDPVPTAPSAVVPGGRQASDGGALSGSGNQGLLDELEALFEDMKDEDVRSEGLMDHRDKDDGRSDSRGRPIKIALTGGACDALEDENLATVLEGVPDAPPDFFQGAFLPEQ